MDTGGSFFLIRRPGQEADHSPPSAPRLSMRGAIPPLPGTYLWHGAWLNIGYVFMARCLVRHRDNLLKRIGYKGVDWIYLASDRDM